MQRDLFPGFITGLIKQPVLWGVAAAVLSVFLLPGLRHSHGAESYTVAVIPFQSDSEELAPLNRTITKMVMGQLAAAPHLRMVEKSRVAAFLSEEDQARAGVERDPEVLRSLAVAGVQILVSGYTVRTRDKLLVNVHITGADTSLVEAFLAAGPVMGKVRPLVEELSTRIIGVISESGPLITAGPKGEEGLVAELKERLSGQRLPGVSVALREVLDGTPQEEAASGSALMKLLEECGFQVYGKEARQEADVLILGEAAGTTGLRRGDLVTGTASLELQALATASGEVIAVGNTEHTAADLFASLAGAKALREATVSLSLEFLEQMVRAWNRGGPRSVSPM